MCLIDKYNKIIIPCLTEVEPEAWRNLSNLFIRTESLLRLSIYLVRWHESPKKAVYRVLRFNVHPYASKQYLKTLKNNELF